MTKPSFRVPVLILGTHITALGVLRVLTARGIPCYVVDPAPDIIVRSRWYRPAERTLSETADSGLLAAYLESLSLSRAVLFPCSDRWTLAVSGLPPETLERFPASVAPREAVEQFVDKERFRALVDRLGIPHPRSLPLRGLADLDRASDDDLANGFLKPVESHRYYQLFGTKGAFVHSRPAAARHVERASAAGITLMLQEWIPGSMSMTIALDGFADRLGTIPAMIARRRIRMDPPRIANTASGVTIPLTEVSEATAAVRTLLGAVSYRGIFNVEFKFDARDGHFKIIEVNPRAAFFVSAAVRAGVDLPWMSYLDAQEQPVLAPPPYQTGRHSVYELPDAAAIVRAWSHFRRPDGPILRPWLRGDRLLLWWSDPLPAGAEAWRTLRRRGGAMLGRLRRPPAGPLGMGTLIGVLADASGRYIS